MRKLVMSGKAIELAVKYPRVKRHAGERCGSAERDFASLPSKSSVFMASRDRAEWQTLRAKVDRLLTGAKSD